jgi:hypothetical protein
MGSSNSPNAALQVQPIPLEMLIVDSFVFTQTPIVTGNHELNNIA